MTLLPTAKCRVDDPTYVELPTDVAVANHNWLFGTFGSVTVFRNTQDWGANEEGLEFADDGMPIPILGQPIRVQFAQIDGVAYSDYTSMDLVVATDRYRTGITILYNAGSGVFNPTERITFTTNQIIVIYGMVVADLDGDDWNDIVVVGQKKDLSGSPVPAAVVVWSRPEDEERWLKQEIDITDGPETINHNAFDVSAAQLRADPPQGAEDSLDLVITLEKEAYVIRCLNNGSNGQGGADWEVDPDEFDAARRATGLVLGHFRSGDDWDAAIAAHDESFYGRARVLFGNSSSDGVLQMTEIDYEFGSGTDPFGVAAGYLNGGDALLDFAVACSSDTTPNSNGGVAVFVNSTQSPGTFSDPAGFYFSAPDGVFTAPWDVKVADMNQDGKDDLIVSNAAAGSVSVLLARY